MLKLLFTLLLSTLPLQILDAQPLKSFSGKDILTEKFIFVSTEEKKALVAVFLSAVCPCSNSHIAQLKSLAKDFPQFSFIAIHSNADESKSETKAYFEAAALPFPVIRDDRNKIADQLRASKTPHAFIFLPNGDIGYQGGVSNSNDFTTSDRNYLREGLEDVLQGRKIRTSEGRTLGCTITRGEKNVW